jgi:DnaJ family protein C protein 3
MRLFALSSFLALFNGIYADASGSSLYPPGLQPLISRANTLLSSGQFQDAAKVYSEAIGMLFLLKFFIWIDCV